MLYKISFLEIVAIKIKKHDKREPGLFKEAFRCIEKIFLVAKLIVATMPNRISRNSVAKD